VLRLGTLAALGLALGAPRPRPTAVLYRATSVLRNHLIRSLASSELRQGNCLLFLEPRGDCW
jgi:hypothetical protein